MCRYGQITHLLGSASGSVEHLPARGLGRGGRVVATNLDESRELARIDIADTWHVTRGTNGEELGGAGGRLTRKQVAAGRVM